MGQPMTRQCVVERTRPATREGPDAGTNAQRCEDRGDRAPADRPGSRGAVLPELPGAVDFSLVFYAGGSIEELADCAENHGVTALYALHAGGWAPYIPGAPDIVNRRFRALFPGGLPAVTPLLVRSEA